MAKQYSHKIGFPRRDDKGQVIHPTSVSNSNASRFFLGRYESILSFSDRNLAVRPECKSLLFDIIQCWLVGGVSLRLQVRRELIFGHSSKRGVNLDWNGVVLV